MSSLFSGRGLHNLISGIRNCSSFEEEQKIVDKQLAKIRNKFATASNLMSYDKKKYAWKLIYIYMLGYEVDFGHMEIINLMSSTKFTEKIIGYLGSSILLKNSDEMMTLIINSLRNDLMSTNHAAKGLALSFAGNIGGQQLCESLGGDILNLFLQKELLSHTIKKTCLCLSRVIQTCPDLIAADEITARIDELLNDKHLGINISASALLESVCMRNPLDYSLLTDSCIKRLSYLVTNKTTSPEYLYYATPTPWLQVKLMKVIQLLPRVEEKLLLDKLVDTLRKILSRPLPGNNARNNALHAILFEAVNVVASGKAGSDASIRTLAIHLLGRCIGIQEPNIRYIGLETMGHFVYLEGPIAEIKKHQELIFVSLKDADDSIRRRALNLLFVLCDAENALQIVSELINYLAIADSSMREEMVLKIAVLAEKFARDLRWYVDTILQLLTIAGNEVTDDVWHRVVQIITNNESLQKYSASAMFGALESTRVDETTIKFGAYVLGEFGYLIVEEERTSAQAQFTLLRKHVDVCSLPTKAQILTSFAKMSNLYPNIRPAASQVLEKYRTSLDLELQQRSCEYYKLVHASEDTTRTVLEAMPLFPSNRESALVGRLRLAGELIEEGSNENNLNISLPSPSSLASDTAASMDLLRMDSPERKSWGGHATVKTLITPTTTSSATMAAAMTASLPQQPLLKEAVLGYDSMAMQKMKSWFNKLLHAHQGVLFENDILQIGVKNDFRQSQGKLGIFFGNKTGVDLLSFQCEIPDVPFLRMKMDALPDKINAKEQIKQQLMVECLQPFTDTVKCNVSFAHQEKQYLYPLVLPICATSFVEPVPLNAEAFQKRWETLAGENREQQASFTSNAPIDITNILQKLTQGVKFHAVEGKSTSSELWLAGTFRTGTATSNGDKISVGCLVWIDMNVATNAYRVTIRALHPQVSVALKSIFTLLLSSSG